MLKLSDDHQPIDIARSTIRTLSLWLAITLLIAAMGAAVYVAFFWRPGPALIGPPAGAAGDDFRSRDCSATAISLPALDDSDEMVRTMMRRLSASPIINTWLSTDDLIRTFTSVVVNVADGVVPPEQVKWLTSPLATAERDGARNREPSDDLRYTAVAAAIGAIDPTAAARTYAALKPRIAEAHRELGSPNESFDRTFERAITLLLSTPIVARPMTRPRQGIVYASADDGLESLYAPQRLLRRMGPTNAAAIQHSLRQLAAALQFEQIRPERRCVAP